MSSLLLVSGANAQSTLDIMRMMNGNGNNETDSSQLMGGIFDGMDSSDLNEVNNNAGEIGPDGMLYISSLRDGAVYRISR